MGRQCTPVAEAAFVAERTGPQMLDQVERQHGFEHRYLHLLPATRALAAEQGHADGGGEKHAAQFVSHDCGQVAGYARGQMHHIGQSALALNHIIVCRPIAIRSVRAVSRRRGVYQAGIALCKRGVAQAQAFGCPRSHAVNEHVGIPDQTKQCLERGRAFEVQHHAFLVAIHVEIKDRHLRMPRRPGIAHRVALRRLDLDYVGAHVAQSLGRERPQDVDGQVEHTHSGERADSGGADGGCHSPALSALRHLIMRSGV